MSGHHEASPLALIPYWVNFILYVGLLYYLLKDQLPKFWKQRREDIANAIENAAAELKNAEAELKAERERFDNVEEETRKINEILRKDALSEHDAILEEARNQCERAIQRAHETIASERLQAEQMLRRELAELVLANTTRRLKEHVSADSDRSRREKVMDGFKQMLQ